jgi:hypothetical protein
MTARTRSCDDNGEQLSGDEEKFAGGLAGFEVSVGVGGVGERVDVFEAELESAVGYAVEDGFRAGLKVGGGGDVVLHGGASDVERAHGGETDEVEGWDGAAGSSEEDHEAAGAEALEGLLEGRLADGVVDDRKEATVGEFFDLRGEVFFGVEDDFVGSGGAGERGFFFGGDGGDDASAEGFGHLDEEEAGAASAGVDEDLLATLDWMGGVGEVVCGDSLDEGSGSLLRGDAFGDRDEAVGGGDGELGVGAGNAAPGDVITGLEGHDVRGDGDDGAGGFLAEGVRKIGGIAAFAEVGVDEVDAGGFDADESFAGAGGWGGKVAESEDVGGTGGEDLDGLHGWMSEYNTEARSVGG